MDRIEFEKLFESDSIDKNALLLLLRTNFNEH
jgi:hypothetical protein